jgi:Arc/MetJ-type ribon-helix-helix transcriptional regulator
MNHELSPQYEQYLDQMVSGGLYPSKEAALEAAIEALREKTEEIPFVPDEHMEAVERGIEEANAGLATPMTKDDWASLRQLAHDVAAGKVPHGN